MAEVVNDSAIAESPLVIPASTPCCECAPGSSIQRQRNRRLLVEARALLPDGLQAGVASPIANDRHRRVVLGDRSPRPEVIAHATRSAIPGPERTGQASRGLCLCRCLAAAGV